MSSYNSATIIGNLGKDPEAFNGGCRLAVATDESYTDKNTGQKVPRTEWHNITVFGKLAEVCLTYLCKGKKVLVEGRLQTDKYQKDGADHYQTKIIANQMRMLSPKEDGQTAPANRPAQQPVQQPVQQGGYDDDIPFMPLNSF